MLIWWALIIPLIASGVLYLLFKHKLHTHEVLMLIGIPAFVIFIFYLVASTYNVQDTQYKSELITKVRYYESWETWVKKTCSYTTCSGSGKSRHCTTHYYDCSYCDYNSEYYVAVTVTNKEISISKTQYHNLLKKWKAIPYFVELHRRIHYHGSCGKDGDMYEANWNLDPYTAQTDTWESSYNNRTQAALSAFNYPKITPMQAKQIGLYEYPTQYYNNYSQPNILGFEQIYQNKALKDSIFILYQYLNGVIGTKYKAHVFILLFKDKDINIAFKQEAYWANGNQNEVVICVGHGALGKIQWIKPFSWCENKRVLVDLREDLFELKYFNFIKAYPIIYKAIHDNFHYRDLDKDFSYLNIELSEKELISAYILTIILTIILCYIFVTNNYEH